MINDKDGAGAKVKEERKVKYLHSDEQEKDTFNHVAYAQAINKQLRNKKKDVDPLAIRKDGEKPGLLVQNPEVKKLRDEEKPKKKAPKVK